MFVNTVFGNYIKKDASNFVQCIHEMPKCCMHNAYLAVQLNKCRCHPISCLFRKSKFSENCYKFKTEIKYFNYRQDVIERVIYKQLRI